MAHSIRTVYVVHHSHTDIGYTDLQERVIDTQAQYIGAVLSLMKQPGYADFRWNCETLFCVEEFFKTASREEQDAFCALGRPGKNRPVGQLPELQRPAGLLRLRPPAAAVAGLFPQPGRRPKHRHVRRHQRHLHGLPGRHAGRRRGVPVRQHPLPPRHVPPVPEPNRLLVGKRRRAEAAGLERRAL